MGWQADGERWGSTHDFGSDTSADDRPPPWLGRALAAGGGTLITIGVVTLEGDHAPTSGPAYVPALACVAMVAVAYVLWRFVPSLVRAALVPLVVIGIGATFAFLFLTDANSFADVRPFLLLASGAWALAWAVGSLRGRALLLALALVGMWFWATGEISKPSTPVGPLANGTSAFAFPFAGTTSSSESFACSSGSSSSIPPITTPDGATIDPCQFTVPPTADQAFQPSTAPFAKVGFLSLLIGIGYFGCLALLDARGKAAAARAFIIPGLIAVAFGIGELAARYHQFWSIGLLTLGVGLFVGATGVVRQRRFTTWAGAFGATIGVVIVSADLTDRAVDLNGSSPATKIGTAFALFGVAWVLAAMAVGRVLNEPDDRESPPAAAPESAAAE